MARLMASVMVSSASPNPVSLCLAAWDRATDSILPSGPMSACTKTAPKQVRTFSPLCNRRVRSLGANVSVTRSPRSSSSGNICSRRMDSFRNADMEAACPDEAAHLRRALTICSRSRIRSARSCSHLRHKLVECRQRPLEIGIVFRFHRRQPSDFGGDVGPSCHQVQQISSARRRLAAPPFLRGGNRTPRIGGKCFNGVVLIRVGKTKCRMPVPRVIVLVEHQHGRFAKLRCQRG